MKNKLRIVILYVLLIVSWIASDAQVPQDSVTALPKSIDSNNTSFFYPINTLHGSFHKVAVDALDNIYVLQPNDLLKKMNIKGDSLAIFNNVKQYGSVSYYDVSNPLKVLVFYKNYATIVMLDRFLSEWSTLNLREKNIFTTGPVATAYDNNIWVFDPQTATIRRIDEVGNLLMQSTDFRQIFYDSVPKPTQIIDKEKHLFLYDSTKGVFEFDYYGTFQKKYNFKEFAYINYDREYFYAAKNDTLFTFNIQNAQIQQYPLPASYRNYKQIVVNNGKLFVVTTNTIYIEGFKFNESTNAEKP